ncbi:hypothetical protein SSIG_01703 [Streptomyces filamentosus NRRL 11379]|nr:conserved hypothetical protein [Streptomyces filamentosus NRRL 15998]EWS91280.1 hypothetical protein SSIG_01703 [Streptomyces filamentosus NRRL 11379]
MAAAAIGLAAPLSSAANESSWDYGCRGYWYTTSGHGYCSYATMTMHSYSVLYDCNVEVDTWHSKRLSYGYKGKFDTHECTFKINKTDVYV